MSEEKKGFELIKEKLASVSTGKKVLIILIWLCVIVVIVNDNKHNNSSYGSSSNNSSPSSECGGNDVNFNAGFESGSQDGSYMIPCESSAGYTMTSERDCYCKGYKAGQMVSRSKAR